MKNDRNFGKNIKDIYIAKARIMRSGELDKDLDLSAALEKGD